jgi:hypothetical protein
MAFTYICFYSVDVAEMAWTGIFLEVLEPYILKDMLGSLPPEVSNTRIHDCYHTNLKMNMQLFPNLFADYASTSRAL